MFYHFMLSLQRIKLYHIMKYEFNKSYFSQLCEDRKLTNVALQNALNMTNTTPMNRWRAGEDIRSCHIVRICNAFNVSPANFYLQDGEVLTSFFEDKQDSINMEKESQSRDMSWEQLYESEKEKCELYKELRVRDERISALESTLRKCEEEIIALRKQFQQA